jgi:hypothetical protein
LEKDKAVKFFIIIVDRIVRMKLLNSANQFRFRIE